MLMKKITVVLAAIVLAACTTPGDLLTSQPTIAATSDKDPRTYALCVLPQWQEHDAGVTMSETISGYRLISYVQSVGQTNELLEVLRTEAGSEVRLYQRMPGVTIGRSRITASVKSCL